MFDGVGVGWGGGVGEVGLGGVRRQCFKGTPVKARDGSKIVGALFVRQERGILVRTVSIFVLN